MSRNSVLLAALGGAAAGALISNYLGTEKGKEMLNSASGALKDLTNKATELAKSNLSNIKGNRENREGVQPS
jgi:hypothetical protein